MEYGVGIELSLLLLRRRSIRKEKKGLKFVSFRFIQSVQATGPRTRPCYVASPYSGVPCVPAGEKSSVTVWRSMDQHSHVDDFSPMGQTSTMPPQIQGCLSVYSTSNRFLHSAVHRNRGDNYWPTSDKQVPEIESTLSCPRLDLYCAGGLHSC